MNQKIMPTPTKQRSRIYTVIQIAAVIAGFAFFFVLGLAVQQLIYGYDFNLTSGPYAEVMNATNNASQYALSLKNSTTG